MNGELLLTVNKANLTHDTDKLSKMDPYVILMCGKANFKTKNSKGKNPEWTKNNSFQFILKGETQIKVVVYDHDTFSSDDLIADGYIDQSKIQNEGKFDIDLTYKKKSAGQLSFSYTFKPTETEKIIKKEEQKQEEEKNFDQKTVINQFNVFSNKQLSRFADQSFDIFDSDNSGWLNKQELDNAIEQTFECMNMDCPPKYYIAEVSKQFDDGDQRINKEEFTNVLLKMAGKI